MVSPADIKASVERLKQKRLRQEVHVPMQATESPKPNGIKHCTVPGCNEPQGLLAAGGKTPKHVESLCLRHRKNQLQQEYRTANREKCNARQQSYRAKKRKPSVRRFAKAKAKVAATPKVQPPVMAPRRSLAQDLATIYRRLESPTEKLVIGNLLADAVLE